ncbi:hypothetical protein PsorP6_016762 [Peronosclerospora sorghi]|uniref:Uncharacterized protein n=1 Tax=Peronosclerospora sorghi TaxID=230839 RepID=A0ACC0WD96_9STRA|nr:hypothetical protein PsorP6_016762 [Peronosclerospora sorghi]
MLDFMEVEENFAVVKGLRSGALIGPPTGGKAPKTAVWTRMASFVNERVSGSNWTSSQAKDRFIAYKKKYRAATAEELHTGMGITDADRRRGIHSVPAKLDSMCPYFARMDALYGLLENHRDITSTLTESLDSEKDTILTQGDPDDLLLRHPGHDYRVPAHSGPESVSANLMELSSYWRRRKELLQGDLICTGRGCNGSNNWDANRQSKLQR